MLNALSFNSSNYRCSPSRVEEDEDAVEPELMRDFKACAASLRTSFISPVPADDAASPVVVGEVGGVGCGSGSVVRDRAAGFPGLLSSLEDGVPGALFALALLFGFGPESLPSVLVGHELD